MKRALLSALTVSASLSAAWLETTVCEAQVVSHTYVNPTLPSGNRLDWCAGWASNCGYQAAFDYCQYMGWEDVWSYGFGGNVGHTELLNGMICDGWCDTFSSIRCFTFFDAQADFEED